MSNSAIQVQALWKEYRLGVISHHTLSRDLQSWWARVRGKEDPNSLVGGGVAPGAAGQRFWALQEVSFEVGQGAVLGIIGRNGAGKSTLLKILSQVTSPTKGELRIKGRLASLLEVGTGFHPELTGRENIFLNGAILGMTKADIRSRLDEIVAFAEVEKFVDTPVKRYSSGMYVRLAFAVAAHLEPEILVVDEVLAVGDAQFQNKCLGKMKEVGREGRTVLLVSHNMAAIQSLCPRAILLEGGRLLQAGPSAEVVSGYYGALFAASGPRDLAGRRDRDGGAALRLLSFDVTGADGASLADVPCGRRVSFEIGFQVGREHVEQLRFGVSLIDKSTGSFVTEFNSYYGSAERFSCRRGFYTFCFTVDKMPLAPGEYNVNLIVTSALELLDRIKDAAQLRVVEGSFYESEQMPLPGSYPLFFTEFHCRLSGEGNCNREETR